MVTRQLHVECRTGRVSQPKTDVLLTRLALFLNFLASLSLCVFVKHPDSFVDYGTVEIICLLPFFCSLFLTYLLISLPTYFLKNRPACFQAEGYRRRPNLSLVFVFVLCCRVFCYGCLFVFVVFDLVFQY